MKTTDNTILITGGSAGIGFEMAKLFSAKGNHVIITGRDADRLANAAKELGNVTTIISDISKEEDTNVLVERIYKDFPNLNLVVNNAGHAVLYSLADEKANAYENASQEMLTNYLAIVRLTEKLLPLLKQQETAAFVNVSSITAFASGKTLPTYGVSKAALHAYSQILRLTLAEQTSVKVFELMPPLVDTTFSAGIGGQNGIKPSVVAERLLQGLENDEYEIHVGGTADLYKVFLSSPAAALTALNSRY